ncbi:MAG: LamG domain-containing protein [Candidatus Micrarchaeota archaeon]|nr:LamG domain-containing protein [Candidatus Micrarchaeota archaeon]
MHTRHSRAQSAMEYLSTYGWAILIIAVVLVALFSLGAFNGLAFAPRAPPGSCTVYRPYGPWSVDLIVLQGLCNVDLPQYVGVFSAANSYVNIGSVSQLEVPSTLTVSAWVNGNPSQTNTNPSLVDKGGNCCNVGYGLFLHNTGSNFNVYARVHASSATTLLSTGSFSYSTWNFVAMTYDGSYVSIYINGAFDKQASNSGGISYGSYNSIIGADSALSEDFDGMISNVQIYNASLSANEIQSLYAEGIGGAPLRLQNLAGWWPLNGNTNDTSGNNANAISSDLSFTSSWTSGYSTP